MPKYMKKKRVIRRRRKSYRKKRGVSRALGINPVIYAKHRLAAWIPIKSKSDGTDVTYNLPMAWQQPGGIISNVNGFNNAPRWAQIRSDYEQYAVRGLKIEWVPTNISGLTFGGVTSNIHSLWMSSDINTYD